MKNGFLKKIFATALVGVMALSLMACGAKKDVAKDSLTTIKENKKVIVFDDIESVKVFDVTMKQMKEYSKPIKPGDAFLCLNGEISKVKTILND